MGDKEKKKKISQEDIMKILDICYSKAINGIDPVSPSIEEFAEDYLAKEQDHSKAAKNMIRNQITKCTTSGFITGFGGFITLPVSIPANVASVLYVQMRMIACAAHLSGLDVKSDQVKTLIYACIAGVSVNEVLKKAGVDFGVKFANAWVKKIPGQVLININQKVGFRFITKAGEKGIINITKMVPVVGAFISGGLDLVETKIIGNRAYKWFFEGDYSISENEKKEFENSDVIDIEEYTIEI